MCQRGAEAATEAARQAGLDEIVEVHQGCFESLPVPDASVDVVISNGVLNLAPEKRAVLDEVSRVLKPGGRLYLADVVVQGQQEGIFRAGLEAAFAAKAIFGVMDEMATDWVLSRRNTRLENKAPDVVAFLLNGLQ